MKYKNYIRLKFVVLISFILLTNCQFSQITDEKVKIENNNKKVIKKNKPSNKDSVKTSTFQKSIQINQEKIDDYYRDEHRIKSIDKQILKNDIEINKVEKRLKNLKAVKLKNEKSKIKQVNELKVAEKQIETITEIISGEAKNLLGEIIFKYKNIHFQGFISNFKEHNISFHLNKKTNSKSSEKFSTLSNVKKYLESKNEDVLMITNGGMYTPSQDPEGLLICNSQIIEPIDTGKGPLNRTLNFYMMPNGIFYIEKNKANILETQDFKEKLINNTIKPIYATQSGPLLLKDYKYHTDLNHNSKSKKIRSGVGVMENGNVVFIISKNSINFHDFTTVFKNILGCKDALFLDGAISLMYLKNSNPSEIGGGFGTIISVTKKSK